MQRLYWIEISHGSMSGAIARNIGRCKREREFESGRNMNWIDCKK